jgi:hypothetical protein
LDGDGEGDDDDNDGDDDDDISSMRAGHAIQAFMFTVASFAPRKELALNCIFRLNKLSVKFLHLHISVIFSQQTHK